MNITVLFEPYIHVLKVDISLQYPKVMDYFLLNAFDILLQEMKNQMK